MFTGEYFRPRGTSRIFETPIAMWICAASAGELILIEQGVFLLKSPNRKEYFQWVVI